MKLNPESLVVETFVPEDALSQAEPPETYECASTGGPWFCPAFC